MNRPWVVAHHTWLTRIDGRVGWRDRLKQWVLHGARNIAVSQAIAAQLQAPAIVIGNPYRDALFRRDPAAERDRELVFLGRLVTDKGLDLLLEAVALRARNRIASEPHGNRLGTRRSKLRRLAAELTIAGQVDFSGLKIRRRRSRRCSIAIGSS